MERAYRATIAAPTENESVCGGGCGSRHGAAHLLRLTGLLDYEVAQAMTKECGWGDHAHDRPGATPRPASREMATTRPRARAGSSQSPGRGSHP